ncbi:MAG: DUF3048 domain-containing protein [Ilumatobacteraceae bacterium]
MSPLKSTRLKLVIAGGLIAVLGACGGSSPSVTTDSVSTETTAVEPVTTTTVPDVIVNPLTGEPAADTSILSRPAMVVKIDNHPKAMPQYGINQADIIFEENVEKLTRFAAVFHSLGSDPVGPIRSGRFQDINLVGSFNKPLFVWSGGNPQVSAAIRKSDLVDLSYTVANKDGGFHRDSSRPAPHDLFAETSKLWTLAPDGSGPPPAQFTYRTASDAIPSSAQKIDGVKLSMDGVKVRWEWSANDLKFLRLQNEELHADPDGVPLNVTNVVILEVEYTNSYSPTSKTLGSGKATVFTGGVAISGTWERSNRLVPFTLTDSSGAIIKLTPGRTFVEVARADKMAIVAVGIDPDEVKYP